MLSDFPVIICSIFITNMNYFFRFLFFFILSVKDSHLLEYCPTHCECEWESRSVSCFEIEVLPVFHWSTEEVWLMETRLSSIPQGSFDNLVNLSHIYVSDDERLTVLDRHSFHNIPSATHIELRSIITLVNIHPEAFKGLPNLKYVGILNSGLTSFPALNNIHSTQAEFIFEMMDNLFIDVIPANSFSGICEHSLTIIFNSNGFKEIQGHAFNGSRLDEVYLDSNSDLEIVDDMAFSGVIYGPTLLDLSETRVGTLPSIGLGSIEKLRAKHTWTLKKLPPLAAFPHLQAAELTYPSHCCGLKKLNRWSGPTEEVICNLTRQAWHHPPGNSSHRYRLHLNQRRDAPLLFPYCPPGGCGEQGWLRLELPTEEPPGVGPAPCGELPRDPGHRGVPCSPQPDALNPCEDVLGRGFLRVSAWAVGLLAAMANLLVLLVLLGSRRRLSVTRFLMCHLALADLCTGCYLLLLAGVDARTRSQYHRHAVAWQTGAGCRLAGALSVLGAELSLYTLVGVTLQRWHALRHALRPQRRPRLRHAAAGMLAGWLGCGVLALLPLLGVSSYGRVSVCLPLDAEGAAARAYVLALLALNGLAGALVCACYCHMYGMVRRPRGRGRGMAGRMAALVGASLLGTATVCVLGLAAALHRPLLSLTHTKVLLVLIYPLNACAHPFLYALLTKAFHWDVLVVLSRMGLCQLQARLYERPAG